MAPVKAQEFVSNYFTDPATNSSYNLEMIKDKFYIYIHMTAEQIINASGGISGVPKNVTYKMLEMIQIYVGSGGGADYYMVEKFSRADGDVSNPAFEADVYANMQKSVGQDPASAQQSLYILVGMFGGLILCGGLCALGCYFKFREKPQESIPLTQHSNA